MTAEPYLTASAARIVKTVPANDLSAMSEAIARIAKDPSSAERRSVRLRGDFSHKIWMTPVPNAHYSLIWTKSGRTANGVPADVPVVLTIVANDFDDLIESATVIDEERGSSRKPLPRKQLNDALKRLGFVEKHTTDSRASHAR